MAALINIDVLKPALQVRSGNTTYDERLTDIVAAASRMIEGECRQSFTYAQRTEYHTARKNYEYVYDFAGVSTYGTTIRRDDQFLILRACPVDETQAFTVWYDPTRQFTDPNTQVNASDIFLDPDPINARMIINAATDGVIMGLKVQYYAGFQVGDDDTLTTDLQARGPDLYLAAQITALHLWNRTNPDLVGSNQESENNKSRWATVNSFGIPKEAQAMLKDYRRVLTGRR